MNVTLAVADRVSSLRQIPARVVWGAADPFQKVHYGQRLANDLHVALERIEGGRHFTPEDHPRRIAAALSEAGAEGSGVDGECGGDGPRGRAWSCMQEATMHLQRHFFTHGTRDGR